MDGTTSARAKRCDVPQRIGIVHPGAMGISIWFKRGLVNGDLRDCDTFSAAQL